MNEYNYMRAITNDVREYISNEIDLDEWKGNVEGLEEHLNEVLWVCDSVTGNGSGSYTFNTHKAEENIAHNWDLLEEALDEWGYDENPIKKGAEWCDVTIRCYLLSNAIAEVLEELEELEDE